VGTVRASGVFGEDHFVVVGGDTDELRGLACGSVGRFVGLGVVLVWGRGEWRGDGGVDVLAAILHMQSANSTQTKSQAARHPHTNTPHTATHSHTLKRAHLSKGTASSTPACRSPGPPRVRAGTGSP